ncbi:Hypothetical predicted protein [Paramuricea clavata]|uniref:Uncharacterized protein n=1 Tax=Paramuricea clavata TaxID=317549 RepID=A0A6S7HHL6_PARCT|nr:Hypothetical predicted protein [Paramuricea clavata]
MGKDKKKEAERQRKLRLNKKTKTKRLEAFWAYAEQKNQSFLDEFLAFYEGKQDNKQDQNQETQQETRETPQQPLGQSSVNNADLDFLDDPGSLDFIDNIHLDFFNDF